MPPRGWRKNKPPLPADNDPRGLPSLCSLYVEAMRTLGYSEATINGRESYLKLFIAWCEDRGVLRPQEVTRSLLERYQRSLFHHRKKNGEPLSHFGQLAPISALRAFFRWLTKKSLILYNPASEMDLPRSEQRLPRHVLSAEEAERVLAQPDVSTLLGLRDRALLETLYSTAIRRVEVCRLELTDLDPGRGTLLVRQGKGKRDRVVPIGERAIAWLRKYLADSRPELLSDPKERRIFVTREGLGLIPNSLTNLVRRYVLDSGLEKAGSCHMFRHTAATLMLEGGADIRYIQQMLGHANLSTTEIYTHVSIRQLKAVHEATHPAAKLQRRTSDPSSEP